LWERARGSILPLPSSLDDRALTNPLILNLEQHDRLSDEEKRVLEDAIAHTKIVTRGEDMVREGDRPKESLLLLEGFAARYKMLQGGKRQITSLHILGDFVDLHAFYLKTLDHAVLALTPCQIGIVPHEALRQITENHPHLGRLLSLNVAIDGSVHRQWLAMTGRPAAHTRFAHLLCELFLRLQSVGQVEGHRFHLPLTQQTLGDMLGLSTVHVNRTLQELRAEGLVSWTRGAVEIMDWERLQQVAEFDPTYLNLVNEPR
jgi:CRP-like cAMP-binding protein